MKDVLILSIPLAGILVATYLMLQHFHNKSIHENEKEIDIQKTKTFFPLQIQAYERVILFLERIDPNNMIIRTHKNGMNAITLHRELLKIVREELSINGDKARYDPIQNKLFVFGKVEVLQNQSTILCDKIIVDLENSSSIMSSDTNKRVEALIINED